MPSQNKKYITRRVLLILTGAFIFIIFGGIGIYKFHWQGKTAFYLSQLIPYPALLVDGEGVSYHRYLDELSTLTRYWDWERNNQNVFLAIPGPTTIRERLVEKLIEEKIIAKWAKQNKVAVNKEDMAKEWSRMQTASSQDDVNAFITGAYGWSEAKFKDKVVKPYLLRQKVESAVRTASGLTDEALAAQAKRAYDTAAAPGADFMAQARAKSLGYVGRGVLPPDLELAVFALEPGDISEPIKSDFGYHIVRVNDVLYDDDKNRAQVNMDQILIELFDFNAWLAEQKKVISIYRLVL